jgi:hypothetical protein
MPLSFPDNPSPNDLYSFDGKTWIWNGSAWDLASAGSINDIPIGNVTANTGNFTTLSVQTGVSSDLSPTANITYDLGNTTNRWNDLWLANSTIYLGEAQISATGATLELPATVQIGNVTLSESGGNLALPENIFANTVTATGNISGEYILGNGSLLTGVSTGGGGTATSGVLLNARVIESNVTISNVYNGFSVGPVTQANNVTVTVATGSRWVII